MGRARERPARPGRLVQRAALDGRGGRALAAHARGIGHLPGRRRHERVHCGDCGGRRGRDPAGRHRDGGRSDGWQRANAETVASQGVKVWVKARGRVPRFFAYASQRHPICVLKTEFTDDDATVLVGFGPDHTRLDVTSVAGVQAAVDALRPGLEVVEVAAHDWMKDPLSRTTWMTHRPGQLTRDLAGLQEPAGVVHFASSDNASLWGGFVDGAIESGQREARRVAAELTK